MIIQFYGNFKKKSLVQRQMRNAILKLMIFTG